MFRCPLLLPVRGSPTQIWTASRELSKEGGCKSTQQSQINQAPTATTTTTTKQSETKTIPERRRTNKPTTSNTVKPRISKPAWGFVLGRRRGGFPMLDWRRNYLNTLVAYRRCVNPGSILIGLRIGRMRQGWYKLALYYYYYYH